MEGSGFAQYKVVIITIDDLIFNLNQIRYDFGNILYQKDFSPITFKEFTKYYGTEKSLYSFLNNLEKEQQINEKIEKFLYSEKNFKNIILNENADELLKLLNRQNKTVVLMTSHSYNLAKVILKNHDLYPYISQVLGLSEFSDKWPSLKVFNALLKYYKIDASEILVITSFNSIIECLDHTSIDTMYVGNPAKQYINSSLKPTYTLSGMFDILEFGLYGKYTSSDIFNPILGFSDEMSDEQKAERYAFLQEKYKDNPELLTVVEDAYFGHDMMHTTSFDTKEFKTAFELFEDEADTKIIPVQEKEKPVKTKKKKNIAKQIFYDLLISIAFVCICTAFHLAVYNHISGKIKEVYDATVLYYPTIANTIFRPITKALGLNGRAVFVGHSILLTFIIYIIIDAILSKLKK